MSQAPEATGERPVQPPSFAPIEPKEIHAFFEPDGVLRVTVADNRSYPKVAVFQSSPLRRPGRFISFLDGASEEIILIDDLVSLAPSSRSVVEEALRRRYLTAKIQRINDIKQEFGVSYWDVETDRGHREFVVQSLTEACQWLSDIQLLIVDVDGNRFEIADRGVLDPTSQRHLDSVL